MMIYHPRNKKTCHKNGVKKKGNMSQPLLVSDPLVRVKTKGRPKAAIRVKHGLEVSLDLKNIKSCGYYRKKGHNRTTCPEKKVCLCSILNIASFKF